MKLVGSLKIGKKTFSDTDSIGLVTRQQLNISDDWYGGSVKEFYRTKYGIYICLNKRKEPVNLLYFEKDLTKEGRILLGLEEEKVETVGTFDVDNASREELVSTAKQLGVSGKLNTFKTDALKVMIKEKL